MAMVGVWGDGAPCSSGTVCVVLTRVGVWGDGVPCSSGRDRIVYAGRGVGVMVFHWGRWGLGVVFIACG